MNKISRNIWILFSKLVGFNAIGSRSCVYRPMQIDNPKTITIGHRTFIGHYAWLMGSDAPQSKGLSIGNRVTIGHFAHIVACKEVVIDDGVLFADKVFVSDCTHNYTDITKPILNQGVSIIKPVHIGEGSWIGENVCVCGASIGKHCVVGANSVVTKDIPDYCVAVGSPAKAIKKYDFHKQKWVCI